MIVHNMKKSLWDKRKDLEYFGEEEVERDGFLHCSTLDQFEHISKKFKDEKEEIVILLLDENKLEAKLVYEDLKNKGIKYPHIYGPINKEAIIKVLPFLKDENGNWIKIRMIK